MGGFLDVVVRRRRDDLLELLGEEMGLLDFLNDCV